MKDLTLIFPQWQGSIDNEALYHGSLELADKINGLPSPHMVEVAPFYALPPGMPIAGKEDILKHLVQARTILETENPDRILLLGGDCSTETAVAPWLNSKYNGDLALIWFDAHPDLNNPQTTQSGRLQGMALSTVLGFAGEEINRSISLPFKNNQVFCAGARVFDPAELDYLVSNKVPFFGPGELERDPSWLGKQACKAGFSRVYIHVDVDAINPMGFPHSKPSPPAGLLFSNVLKILEALHSELEVAGLGITEFHPGNERGTAKAAQLVEAALPNFIFHE